MPSPESQTKTKANEKLKAFRERESKQGGPETDGFYDKP